MLRLGTIAFTLIICVCTLTIIDHLTTKWKEVSHGAFQSNR
jgi:hypothetical protein